MKKIFTLLALVALTITINAAELTVANHISFRNCDAVSDLPWTEGFESVEENAIPTCWDRTDENRVYVNEDIPQKKRAHSGTKCLRISQTTIFTPITVVLQACATPIKN